MTLDRFILETGITLTSRPADRNPHMEGSDNMDNYHVKLRRPVEFEGHETMRLYFSKGIGLKGEPPTVAEVLDCLASDAAGVDNSPNFEDWCADYGYDTDSRRAAKTFKACQREASKLNRFLGADYYQTLLYDIERL